MQPYFFPYLGYFQLINSIDVFVYYDDVNFIKRGWVNRNNILVNGQSNLFKVPLIKASQNKLINELEIDLQQSWKINMLKTIKMSYKKAPFFDDIFPILENIINYENANLAKYLINSLEKICNLLNLKKTFILSSDLEKNNSLRGQQKIINICNSLNCSTYINAIGGKDLYNKLDFKKNDLNLKFLNPKDITYSQFNNEYVPWLSIIDLLMFNSKDEIQKFLNNYELI